MMINQSIDIAVVGAGMVGAAAALGLAQAGFRVAVIEKMPPADFSAHSDPDIRVSAVGQGSVDLLKSLGVWQDVMAMRAHAYRHLETWEQNDARVTFSAAELQLSELGYMVENRVLQRALWHALHETPGIMLCCPATLAGMQRSERGYQLTFVDHPTLDVRLVIGADGAHSQIRQWAGIAISGWQYRQACMLITCKQAGGSGDRTWQHFTPDGPRAFLPLSGEWASLVWYDSPARIRQLQQYSMPQLQKAIRDTFPARIGNVTPIAAGSFPLTRQHAAEYVLPGVALIGDAAHTIHPLAGQGVNLGYRDVRTLSSVLIHARDKGEEWSDLGVLHRYQKARKADNLLMQTGMDLFYAGFSNRLPPLKLVRNLGLKVAQRSGELKRMALKYALGIDKRR